LEKLSNFDALFSIFLYKATTTTHSPHNMRGLFAFESLFDAIKGWCFEKINQACVRLHKNKRNIWSFGMVLAEFGYV